MARLNRAKPSRESPRRAQPTRQMGHGGRQRHWRPTIERGASHERHWGTPPALRRASTIGPAQGTGTPPESGRLGAAQSRQGPDASRRGGRIRRGDRRAKVVNGVVDGASIGGPRKRAGDTALSATLFATGARKGFEKVVRKRVSNCRSGRGLSRFSPRLRSESDEGEKGREKAEEKSGRRKAREDAVNRVSKRQRKKRIQHDSSDFASRSDLKVGR